MELRVGRSKAEGKVKGAVVHVMSSFAANFVGDLITYSYFD
jgi:hypothetical protein